MKQAIHSKIGFLFIILLFLFSSSILADPPRPNPDQPLFIPDAPQGVGGYPLPTSGNQPLLVVLVEFSDRDGIGAGGDFVNFFKGSGKFVDYFTENSYGQLLYGGGGKPVDIVGNNGNTNANISAGAYVRLPNPVSYYAAGNYGNNVGDNCNGQCSGGAVKAALQKLSNQGFDFSPYVTEGTNYVENLVVVFAGWSSRDDANPNGTLQPTAYALAWTGYWDEAARTIGGYVFNQYTLCPDRKYGGGFEPIGICVHEHGHGLGLPDLYNLNGINPRGMGYIDLMGYGTWGAGSGEVPYHIGAFGKNFVGWASPQVHDVLAKSYVLNPAETDPSSFIKVYPYGNPQASEFFLIENRQAVGFDGNLAGRGLCAGVYIWHVDQNVIDNHIFAVNTPGYYWNPPPHNGVRVVEGTGAASSSGAFQMANSDNLGSCEDSWKAGQTWTGGTLHDGKPTGITVAVSAAAGNALNVNVTLAGIVTPVELVHPLDESTVNSPIVNFEWAPTSLPVTKYIFKVKSANNTFIYSAKLTPDQVGCAGALTNCTYDPFNNNLSLRTYSLKQWRDYRWRVQYRYDGVMVKSSWNDFFVDVSDGYAIPLSPDFNSVVTDPNPTFEWWQNSPDVTDYKFYMYNAAGTYRYRENRVTPEALGCVIGEDNVCTLTPSKPEWLLKSGKNYKWRVHAYMRGGTSTFKLKGTWTPFSTDFSGAALPAPDLSAFRN